MNLTDDVDDDDPNWLINAQIKGLLCGEGASEDHENVIEWLERAGLPGGTARRVHEAICRKDPALRPTQIGPVTVDETGIDRLDVVLQHALQAVKDRDARIADLEARPDPLAELHNLGEEIHRGVVAAAEAFEKARGGWVTANARGDAFRTIDNDSGGIPTWTNDMNEALRFERRADAEMFAHHDEDAWRMVRL